MSEQKVNVQVGPGLPGLLFLVFLALKLTGTIAWSWWWVTAPLWGGLALVLGILLCGGAIFGCIAGIGAFFAARAARKLAKEKAERSKRRRERNSRRPITGTHEEL